MIIIPPATSLLERKRRINNSLRKRAFRVEVIRVASYKTQKRNMKVLLKAMVISQQAPCEELQQTVDLPVQVPNDCCRIAAAADHNTECLTQLYTCNRVFVSVKTNSRT